MARTKQQIKDAMENVAVSDAATAVVADNTVVETPVSDGTPDPVATAPSQAALSLSRVQRGIPYNGFIRLTGASYHANPKSDRGRAWATLKDGANVAEQCRVMKAAGNRGCGVGDLEILAGKWGAIVITDAVGAVLYPASAVGKAAMGAPPVVVW